MEMKLIVIPLPVIKKSHYVHETLGPDQYGISGASADDQHINL